MKKIYFILLIIFSLITVGLFPLDLFLSAVPEWVIFIFIAAVIILAVLVFIRGKSRLPAKIISAVLAGFVTVLSLAGIYIDPYFNSMTLHVTPWSMALPYDTVITADKAQADIDYAMKYLKKIHPMFLNGVPAEVQTAYDTVSAEIKNAGSVTVCELAKKAARIFSVLSDAHTCVSARYTGPLYLKHYYKWKTGSYAVSAINGITIKELLERSVDLYSFEAESWELNTMKNDLLTVQGLTYLGFSVPDGITYTFTDDDGNEETETYYPEDYVTYDEYVRFNGLENEASAKEEKSFVSFTVDEENSLALLTLDECNYNSEYINCVCEMFTEVKNKGIKNVAVDLRENGGGNSLVAEEFIKYLDTDEYRITTENVRLGFFNVSPIPEIMKNERYSDLTFRGNVYILTSAGSFSSAMLFTQYIKDNGLGTLIGEPPGNDPNGYGDITSFGMPNSGVWFFVSTKKFVRADRNCPDRYVMPNIPCEADKAFDVLYETING